MVEINLLPWRQRNESYQAARLRIIIASACLSALVMVAVIFGVLRLRLHQGESRIDKLKSEIQFYDSVKPRQVVADQQEESLFSITALLFNLSKTHHKDVCFTGLILKKEAVEFAGMARSATDLTAFLQHETAMNAFNEIRIKRIDQHDDGFVTFSIVAHKGG